MDVDRQVIKLYVQGSDGMDKAVIVVVGRDFVCAES